MTTGYVVSGRGDLDVLFKARTSAAIADTGFKSNGGVDLAQRFEPRGSTTAIANTNFKAGANDLAALFMDIAAASNTINVDNRTVSAHNTGSAGVASYSLTNAGDIRFNNGTNTIIDQGDWITPQTNMSLYSARMTIISGGSTSGTFGSYLNLGTTRTWTLSGGSGGVDATWQIDIRRDSDSAVMDTATLTVHAERDA
jgi:hypothetical protein